MKTMSIYELMCKIRDRGNIKYLAELYDELKSSELNMGPHMMFLHKLIYRIGKSGVIVIGNYGIVADYSLQRVDIVLALQSILSDELVKNMKGD